MIDCPSIINVNRLIDIDCHWLLSIAIDYRFHRLFTSCLRGKRILCGSKNHFHDSINFFKNQKSICSLLNQSQFVNNYLGSGKVQEQGLDYLQSCLCALLLMRIMVLFSGKTCIIFTSVISELCVLFLVGSSDQTWSLSQGYEDQNLGTHLPLLSSHQGKYHWFYLLGHNDTVWVWNNLLYYTDSVNSLVSYRSMRSLISFLDLPWKMRYWKSCRCRNKPGQDSVHVLKPLLPLATAMAMWVLVSNALKKWLQPSVGLSSLLSCLSFQFVVAIGVTRSVNPILSLARYVN